MGNRLAVRVYLLLAVAGLAATALIAPTAAGAATVVNGDFESGNLDGWQLVNEPDGSSGSWYAYSGTVSPKGATVPSPPAGTFAAITDQEGPGTRILYQDVALEPFYSHELSLIAYYHSRVTPPTTPTPDSLHQDSGVDNQQYRIDVVKPTADVYSLEPDDILATVFATKSGDQMEVGPTTYTADLSPFAGQTVRLRFAEVDNRGNLWAGADSVAIASTPPSNAITFRKPILRKKKGTAALPVTLPGAGTVKIADVKKTKKRIKAKTLTATAAGTLKLPVKPTKSARHALLEKGKQKLKVAVTFTPVGGFAATTTRKLTLKLTPKK